MVRFLLSLEELGVPRSSLSLAGHVSAVRKITVLRYVQRYCLDPLSSLAEKIVLQMDVCVLKLFGLDR